jgi:hypothetical protein
VFGDQSLEEMLKDVEEVVGFDPTSNPQEAKRKLEKVSGLARSLGQNVKVMVDTQKEVSQFFRQMSGTEVSVGENGVVRSVGGQSEAFGAATTRDISLVMKGLEMSGMPVDDRTRGQVTRGMAKVRQRQMNSTAGRSIMAVEALAASVPGAVPPALLEEFRGAVLQDNPQQAQRAMRDIERRTGMGQGEMSALIKDEAAFQDFMTTSFAGMDPVQREAVAEQITGMMNSFDRTEIQRRAAQQTQKQASAFVRGEERRLGLKTGKPGKEFRKTFVKGVNKAIGDIEDDDQRKVAKQIFESAVESGADVNQLTRMLNTTMGDIGVEGGQLVRAGLAPAESQQRAAVLKKVEKIEGPGRAGIQKMRQHMAMLVRDPAKRREMNKRFTEINKSMAEGTPEAIMEGQKKLEDLIGDKGLLTEAQRKGSGALWEGLKDQEDRRRKLSPVHTTPDGKRVLGVMPTHRSKMMFGGFTERKTMEHMHRFLNPLKNMLTETGAIEQQAAASRQAADIMATQGTPVQRLAKLALDKKEWNAEGIARAMGMVGVPDEDVAQTLAAQMGPVLSGQVTERGGFLWSKEKQIDPVEDPEKFIKRARAVLTDPELTQRQKKKALQQFDPLGTGGLRGQGSLEDHFKKSGGTFGGVAVEAVGDPLAMGLARSTGGTLPTPSASPTPPLSESPLDELEGPSSSSSSGGRLTKTQAARVRRAARARRELLERAGRTSPEAAEEVARQQRVLEARTEQAHDRGQTPERDRALNRGLAKLAAFAGAGAKFLRGAGTLPQESTDIMAAGEGGAPELVAPGAVAAGPERSPVYKSRIQRTEQARRALRSEQARRELEELTGETGVGRPQGPLRPLIEPEPAPAPPEVEKMTGTQRARVKRAALARRKFSEITGGMREMPEAAEEVARQQRVLEAKDERARLKGLTPAKDRALSEGVNKVAAFAGGTKRFLKGMGMLPPEPLPADKEKPKFDVVTPLLPEEDQPSADAAPPAAPAAMQKQEPAPHYLTWAEKQERLKGLDPADIPAAMRAMEGPQAPSQRMVKQQEARSPSIGVREQTQRATEYSKMVQQERESGGPEAGGSKTRDRADVTVHPGSAPIPVIIQNTGVPLRGAPQT